MKISDPKRPILSSRFLKSEDGSQSIEACLVIPTLFWIVTAMIVFCDAFMTQVNAAKANYAVADMISRETAPIDDDYITALSETFDYLVSEEGASTLRVSVVEWTADPDTGEESASLVWSSGVDIDDLDDIEQIRHRVPELALGEQIIIVESQQVWTPGFAIGLSVMEFSDIALSRPRFAPHVCWETPINCAAS